MRLTNLKTLTRYRRRSKLLLKRIYNSSIYETTVTAIAELRKLRSITTESCVCNKTVRKIRNSLFQ